MTDPNVIEAVRKIVLALDLLAIGNKSEDHIVALSSAALRVVRAAAEKPAAQTDGPVPVGIGALLSPGRAEKPAEAAPVAPLPWVVRRRDDKTVVATFLNVVYAGDYHRVILGDSDTFEVVPAAAPTVAAVGFNEFGVARGDGWTADYDHSDATRTLRVYIGLRPGEDAGETLAKALAAVGRTA